MMLCLTHAVWQEAKYRNSLPTCANKGWNVTTKLIFSKKWVDNQDYSTKVIATNKQKNYKLCHSEISIWVVSIFYQYLLHVQNIQN